MSHEKELAFIGKRFKKVGYSYTFV